MNRSLTYIILISFVQTILVEVRRFNRMAFYSYQRQCDYIYLPATNTVYYMRFRSHYV